MRLNFCEVITFHTHWQSPINEFISRNNALFTFFQGPKGHIFLEACAESLV